MNVTCVLCSTRPCIIAVIIMTLTVAVAAISVIFTIKYLGTLNRLVCYSLHGNQCKNVCNFGAAESVQ